MFLNIYKKLLETNKNLRRLGEVGLNLGGTERSKFLHFK